MENTEKSYTDKHKKILNYRNYNVSFMLTSLLVSDLEYFQCLTFVA
jgi:hypothetical protein